MKCPKCKGIMKVNVQEKRYLCEKCKNIIEWYNPENVQRSPLLSVF